MRLTSQYENGRHTIFKDGNKVIRISSAIIKDLKELHGIDVADELINALRYEVADPTLDDEVDTILQKIKEEEYSRPSMTINDYQAKAVETAIYGDGQAIIYPTLGLTGEAGEVADKVKKVLRDKGGVFSEIDKIEIAKEIGDVCWYIAALCRDLGISMEEVCQTNLIKLASRKERGVIAGSGDNR